MRAVVIDTDATVRVDTRPDPVLPGPDGAVVEVTASAICGSDLHFLEGHYPIAEPASVGHEAVGVVAEIGSEVRGFNVGDRVLVSSVAGCGRCAGCRTADPGRCVCGPQIFGSGLLGGVQADLLAVPAADFQLLRIPEGIDTEAALLLTDNLATGWAAAKRADIPLGGTVAVIGAGAVGQCALRSALRLGAATVFVVDPVADRRDRAAAVGAGAVPVSGAGPAPDGHPTGRGVDGGDRRGGHRQLDSTTRWPVCADRWDTAPVVGVHDRSPTRLPASGMSAAKSDDRVEPRAGEADLAGTGAPLALGAACTSAASSPPTPPWTRPPPETPRRRRGRADR